MAFRLFKYFPWNMEGSLEHCHFPFRCCLAHLRKLIALLRFRKKHLFYLRFHFATNVLPPPPPPLLQAKPVRLSTLRNICVYLAYQYQKKEVTNNFFASWKCTKLSERKPSHILHTTTKKQIIYFKDNFNSGMVGTEKVNGGKKKLLNKTQAKLSSFFHINNFTFPCNSWPCHYSFPIQNAKDIVGKSSFAITIYQHRSSLHK